MGVSSIIQRGFGSWGGVNLIPTLGYGVGSSAATTIDATTTLGFTAAASVTFTTATTISAASSIGFTAAASVTFTTSALTISAATTLGFTAAATVTLTTATTISVATTVGFTAAATVTFGSSALTIAAATTIGFTASAQVAFATATTIAATTTLGFTASAVVTLTTRTTIAASTTLGFTASAVVALTGNTTFYASELEAIQATYLANAGLVAAVSSRWYLDEAPEGTILPYVTMTLVSRSHEQTTGLVRAVESVVQVSIHHRLPSLCKPIRTLILGSLDRVAMPIGGNATGHCLLENEIVSKAEGKAPGGKDCWMHMLDFSILHSPDTGS